MSESEPVLGIERVMIIGLGLMGGSLARALQGLSTRPSVAATSLDGAELRRALNDGVIDEAVDKSIERAIGEADFIVYATPIGVTLELLRAHAGSIPSDATVTDLGSAKRAIMQRAAEAGLRERFIGSHPLAGSHDSGYGASRADLFQSARVFLTRASDAPARPGEADAREHRVHALWRAVGARPKFVSAEEHDALMAWVSHLPQIAASALGAALATSEYRADEMGPGGHGATRLALSSPELWADILEHNADALAEPLAALSKTLAELSEAVRNKNTTEIERIMSQARRWRLLS
jgi:prephenate dehydrogenase